MQTYSSSQPGFVPREQWDEFTQRPGLGHLLQSWTWGQFKADFGWEPLRLAIVQERRIVAAAQVLFRSLPMGRFTTAYVPKGPLIDASELSTPPAAALLSALHEACRRRHAISLKLEPDWEAGPSAAGWLTLQGFVRSAQTVQPQRTVIVDLTMDEDAILAQMKPKTRYNIRLAQRKGIVVHIGGAESLPVFYQLLQITGRRDGFGIHTHEYYSQAWRLFADQGAVALFLANYGDTPLAAILAFAWGKKAWYMYGASCDEERQRMPNYLLQWEAMRWAKARGCETYDLWGIPDVDEGEIGNDVAAAEEQGVLSSGLGGLYRFKRGFGGRQVRCVGAYDYIYNKPLYHLMTAIWNWRRRH